MSMKIITRQAVYGAIENGDKPHFSDIVRVTKLSGGTVARRLRELKTGGKIVSELFHDENNNRNVVYTVANPKKRGS